MAAIGTTISLSDIREDLKKFPGGLVNMTKNEELGIAKICFSNPSKKNAFSGEMMVDLADIVAVLEKWEKGKGLLFYSTGNDFCSGADLSMMSQTSNHDTGKNMCLFMQNTLSRLAHLPFVSVVLVQGKAIGGGTELITAFDFRLVTQDFSCNMVHLKMGLITGWGGATRLVRLLGPTTALRLMGSCANLSSTMALDVGLATHVLSNNEELVNNASTWLLDHTKGDPTVVRAMKSVVIHASTLSLQESLDQERDLFGSLWGGPANKEALKKNLKHKS